MQRYNTPYAHAVSEHLADKKEVHFTSSFSKTPSDFWRSDAASESNVDDMFLSCIRTAQADDDRHSLNTRRIYFDFQMFSKARNKVDMHVGWNT
jgi:hypothetical protein